MCGTRIYIDELIYNIEKNGIDKDLFEKSKAIYTDDMLVGSNTELSKNMEIALDNKDSGGIIEYLKFRKISNKTFKIVVENLGRIEKGEYSINGMTPLTGPSDLGKSTILKAMYFATKVCNEYYKEKKTWVNQLEGMTYEGISQKFDVVSYKDNKGEALEDMKNLTIDKLVAKFVSSVYSSVFDYVSYNTRIELFVDGESVFHMDRETGSYGVDSQDIDVIYISDSKILNYLSYMTNDSARKIGIKTNIACPDYIRDLKERLSSAYIDTLGWFNEEKKGTDLSDYLSVKDTPVIYEQNAFKVKSSSGDYCRPSEVGDGLKLKAILYTLAFNGHINKNTVLLLDEPESSLYPVEYEELINIFRALGCPVGMATHSPSLVEKCSEYSSKCYIAEKVNNFTTIKESDSSESIMKLLSKTISEVSINEEL